MCTATYPISKYKVTTNTQRCRGYVKAFIKIPTKINIYKLNTNNGQGLYVSTYIGHDLCLIPLDEEEHKLLSVDKEQPITTEEKRDHLSQLEETLEEDASLEKLSPLLLFNEPPEVKGEYHCEPMLQI